MIGLHITDVKKSIIIALFVATTMMITSGAHGDTPVCPCNDNGQYDYLASDTSASRCDTAPVQAASSAERGGRIVTHIISAYGTANVTLDNLGVTHEIRASCTNLISGQPLFRTNITVPEGHVCIVKMMQSCRDAGF